MKLSIKKIIIDTVTEKTTNYFITSKLYISSITGIRKNYKLYWTNYYTIGLWFGSRAIELNYYKF